MDLINREILATLKKNGRIGWGDLSSQLGISRQALRKRIERLEYTNQIVSYTIITSHNENQDAEHDLKAGVRAFLNIRFSAGNDCFKLSKILSTYKNIEGMWALTGHWDMQVLIEAQKMEQISEVRELIVSTGHIEEIKTNAILNVLN